MGGAELEHIALLEGVSPVVRRELARVGQRRHLEAGAVLIRQGEHGHGLFFVLQGELAVLASADAAEPLAVLGAGETVGEVALITGEAASVFVVARAETELLSLDEAASWELVQTSHAFALNLLARLAERLRRSNVTVSRQMETRRLFECAAMFDALTGVHSRRWLDEALSRLVERAGRSGEGLCVAMVDVDHFKRFNDQHGHEAGDVVLAQVARVLSANLRPTDLVARYGGEEFVVLLPGALLPEAALAGERLREAVAHTAARCPDGRRLPPITVSVGVTSLRADDTPAGLLKAADQAMYEAKAAGRNRVVTARREV